ncbi:Uncharacterised protein [Serratia marcescens]|uniref:phage tail terminator protein n=1 Tax=Serratia marcescens TaxID=615 RepID=UPI000744E372|nr:hypothetical protein [Serratia marcescens]CUZ06842.1 Uncharacterised protein [Serratia marcescens]CUZ36440.1 Uncharacterised protein [Serratia marcescens]CUZ78818.1 Uncharacterised protein [Serratia marcescens]CUZ99871.1 Uncharacterised protein [Serratia marcescens]CVB37568.1 Uncharacterised protein [Serratia marcescens]
MVTDYLFCEPLLIGRLRAAVPEFVEVTGVAGLSQMNDDNPICPMAYVMYLGDTVNTSTAATGGGQRRLQFVTQLWAVVVCVYFADGRGLGADISSEAGPLMLKTVEALAGWSPLEGVTRQLARSNQSLPAQYESGYGYYPLVFQVDVPAAIGGYQ